MFLELDMESLPQTTTLHLPTQKNSHSITSNIVLKHNLILITAIIIRFKLIDLLIIKM